MARCFEESQQAFTNGSKARAKELSNDGKNHKAVMEELNRQASEWIFAGMSLNLFNCWLLVLNEHR